MDGNGVNWPIWWCIATITVRFHSEDSHASPEHDGLGKKALPSPVLLKGRKIRSVLATSSVYPHRFQVGIRIKTLGLVGLFFGDCTFCPVLFLFFFITDFRWTLNFFHPPFFFWTKKQHGRNLSQWPASAPLRSFFRTTLFSILRIPRTGTETRRCWWQKHHRWMFGGFGRWNFSILCTHPKKEKRKKCRFLWCFANSVSNSHLTVLFLQKGGGRF